MGHFDNEDTYGYDPGEDYELDAMPADMSMIDGVPIGGIPYKSLSIVKVHGASNKAWKLTIIYEGQEQTCWFPKSKCTLENDQIIRVPLWLIRKKNWKGAE